MNPPAPATPPEAPGRWLAIETAGLYGSIALAEAHPGDPRGEPRLIQALDLPRDARSARTLAPGIDRLLRGVGWAPDTLAAVAVAVGPGSFTGLRVGVVTAKTLCYATGAAVLGVDTLDALAEGADPPTADGQTLWTAIDAHRGELFAASFAGAAGRWRRRTPTRRLGSEGLTGLAAGATVVGPGVEASAEGVLRAAWQRCREGAEPDSVLALAPQYHRASAAEEKVSGG